MREQIENVVSRVADTARNGINTAVDATQDRVGQAGRVVADTKKPVQKVSKATLDANAIAFRTSKELIELQSKSIQRGIDAVAKRLRDASRVDSVRELIAMQRDVVPAVAGSYVNDVKDAFGILRGAAGEFGGVVGGLRGTTTAKKTVKKAAKTVRKTAKKAPARAKATAKTAAKKVANAVAEAEKSA
ncbi:MAG: phasin family protein [Pseudomonadota bacterium]